MSATNSVFPPLVCHSPSMQYVRERLMQCSQNDNPVLIVGPCGAGKTLVAQELHRLTRRELPFEVFLSDDYFQVQRELHCAEASEVQLNSSGLYAHSGIDRIGIGTLVFEWLDTFSQQQQGAVLAELTHHKYRARGDSEKSKFKGRIVATVARCPFSNKTNIRPELLARFEGNIISVPPLSCRSEDFEEVVGFLLSEMGYSQKIKPEVVEFLSTQTWPFQWHGVRGFLQMLTSQKAGTITVDNCHQLIKSNRRNSPLPNARKTPRNGNEHRECDKHEVLKVIELHQGNISRAAAELGINRTALRRKIVALGIASLIPANRAGRPAGQSG